MNTKTYARGELLIFLVNAQSPDTNDDKIAVSFAGTKNLHYAVISPCTVYGAWNYAIRKTQTPYLTNANTDDIVSPECYDKLITACEKHKAILAYPDWYVIKADNLTWPQAVAAHHRDRAGQYNPPRGQLSCGHFPLWKREIHKRVGLFDPWFRALGDADLWYRCWVNGIKNFHYHGECLGGYLWRAGQNLWHKTDQERRRAEWVRLYSRKAGEKLKF